MDDTAFFYSLPAPAGPCVRLRPWLAEPALQELFHAALVGRLGQELDAALAAPGVVEDGAAQELAELQAKLLGGVQKKMSEIAADIAKERKIDLLLERNEGGVVYFQPSFDITDELIKRYKAK